ncbi:hypothetical protein WNZ14_05170 [Hoeflea sp. AS60]|uniref:hypothetical protein n=1 Tax=Hoeflea sp. AS60 TaxID=3135780 RepID=UPI00317B415F
MKLGWSGKTYKGVPEVPFRKAARKRKQLASVRQDLPLAYFIGDSHVSVFSGIDAIDPGYPAISDSLFPNVRICRLGAPLAATMTREDATEGGRAKAFSLLSVIEPGARVFLSFGEIDCRVHIPRRAGFEGSGIPMAVESAMVNYLHFADEYRSQASARGIDIGLLSPPPTATFDSMDDPGHLFRMLRKSRNNHVARAAYRVLKNLIPRSKRMHLNNAHTPAYADAWALRNQALGCMRDRMREYCQQRDLPFIDMFGPFLGTDGKSARHWFMDEIHLGVIAIPEVAADFAACGIPNFSPDIAGSTA